MLSHVDEAKRREALALVREGRLYDLGRVLDENVPVFPGRYFRQTLVTTAHHANARWRRRGEPTSTGSPSRSPARCSSARTSTRSATCRSATAATTAGRSPSSPARPACERLGVETVPQIVTRGWLVDASGAAPGDVIGLDDRRRASTRRPATRSSSTPAGARTGTTRTPTSRASPGPAASVAAWLAERGVALTGCDTWSYGPVPAEDPERPFEVPQILNVEHGVFIVENLDTARARRRRRARVRPDPDPPEAARRHRRLDVTDRPRLTGGLAMASSTTT